MLTLAWLAPPAAVACDVCAIYAATEMREARPGLFLGFAEQYSSFGTLRQEGKKVRNFENESLQSSISQFVVGYSFGRDFSVHVAVPVIHRTFRRRTARGTEEGDETGFGDVSLLGTYRLFRHVDERNVFRFSVHGGMKLPSGDTSRLESEAAREAEDDHDEELRAILAARPLHDTSGAPPSGVHDHDLALGTGSVDGVIGARFFASRDRLFWSQQVQYMIRREGDFGYRYANDLTWSGGPGVFVLTDHQGWGTLALQAVLSGEAKGKDSVDGDDIDDTAITALYVGPGVSYTRGNFVLQLAGDLPAIQNNSSLQIVPDYRFRASIRFQF